MFLRGKESNSKALYILFTLQSVPLEDPACELEMALLPHGVIL